MTTFTVSTDPAEVRALARVEHEKYDFDAETVRTMLAAADRQMKVYERLRVVALEASRTGRFADLADDDNDLKLVLEYARLAAWNELAKWREIAELTGPSPETPGYED